MLSARTSRWLQVQLLAYCDEPNGFEVRSTTAVVALTHMEAEGLVCRVSDNMHVWIITDKGKEILYKLVDKKK